MFELKGLEAPVLVSSVDGVGTKLKLAVSLDRFDTVGIDIVNHSVNDILTSGARPLFFLDYIAMGVLEPAKVLDIVKGLSMACREAGCALIGGETAEMPGLYSGRDFDLAGCIVGVVEKSRIIDGQSIEPGDVVLGLPSSGLHTNGYSLARSVLGENKASLDKYYVELGGNLGDVLMEPHRSYLKELNPVLAMVKGLAHITGGGFPGNIPRILPASISVRIDTGSWVVPPVFKLIQKQGNIARDEMYRVFNMGIGMVIVASPEQSLNILEKIGSARVIGGVIARQGDKGVVLV
jgi:phosphoribosylformylglycinamidine cyclo-ligase